MFPVAFENIYSFPLIRNTCNMLRIVNRDITMDWAKSVKSNDLLTKAAYVYSFLLKINFTNKDLEKIVVD